jgi:K+-transporting ATPase ATPase B chain
MKEIAQTRRRGVSAWDGALIKQAVLQSFPKLAPRSMVKNPVMLVVEIGSVLTTLVLIQGLLGLAPVDVLFVAQVTLWLWFTVLFANFAEAMAEARGKAQADTLRRTRRDTPAKLVQKDGSVKTVSSTDLRKGDIVIVEAEDLVPSDGTVVEGVAYVNEAAITGESAPVLKEPGSDVASSVTGGTQVISDWVKVEITSNPGETFLDRMIALVEGAKRQRTPNEIALSILLAGLTIVFLLAVVTLQPFAIYAGGAISVVILVALLVCLIPTTIGGLLSAIGIAGMDRVTRFNVLAMSGRAVEAAGDVDTLLLDKTGTITFGNRMAYEFVAVGDVSRERLVRAAYLASLGDETPEGRSVVTLARRLGVVLGAAPTPDASPLRGSGEEDGRARALVGAGVGAGVDPGAATDEVPVRVPPGAEVVPFTAETRMSGLRTNGTALMKGAVDSIVAASGTAAPPDLQVQSERISREGGTPLAVSENGRILGLVYLKDTVKPGMKDRFDELRRMGIRTVMVTGDNRLTAATIAREAGVDDFVAEAKPEDKIDIIRGEQALGKLVAMTGDGTNDAPALAQADVGLAMNSGTQAAREAANMVDLDSDPTKLIEVVLIGKQLLITRGAVTTFSVANDVAKYFAIIPAMFAATSPALNALNIMHLATPESAILSAVIFNALIIIALVPLALKGVAYRAVPAATLLQRNLLIYGVGGIVVPFIGIKIIDVILAILHLA